MRIRALTAVVLMLVLAGCTHDLEKPSVLPPAGSPSPKPTLAPVPVPSLPAAAMAETSQGASAFGRHVFAVLTVAFQNSDPAPFKALTAPGCSDCSAVVAQVDERRTMGQRIEGGAFTVVGAATPGFEGERAIVDLVVRRSALTVIGSDGSVVRDVPDQPDSNFQLALLRRDSSWLLTAFTINPAPAALPS